MDDVIAKTDKTEIAKVDQVDSVSHMLYLVSTWHTAMTHIFPPELILAICREESHLKPGNCGNRGNPGNRDRQQFANSSSPGSGYDRGAPFVSRVGFGEVLWYQAIENEL